MRDGLYQGLLMFNIVWNLVFLVDHLIDLKAGKSPWHIVGILFFGFFLYLGVRVAAKDATK